MSGWKKGNKQGADGEGRRDVPASLEDAGQHPPAIKQTSTLMLFEARSPWSKFAVAIRGLH